MNNSSGILLLDKPIALSSAAVLRKIEKKFRIKKIGHGGTLDPFASGLLIVLLGEATKIARFLLTDEKSYTATITTGFSTDTGDHTGSPVHYNLQKNDATVWEAAKKKFIGKIQQIPPQYSAIKVNGKPLYSYARNNQFIEIPPREVTIYELRMDSVSENTVEFFVRSSGGTYIRTLAEDWSKEANSLGHLSQLRRTHIGTFSLENAWSLEKLLEQEQLPSLLSIPNALAHLPQIVCSDLAAQEIHLGIQSNLDQLCTSELSSKVDFSTINHVLLTQKRITTNSTLESVQALALLHKTGGDNKIPRFLIDRVFHSQHS